MVDGKLCPFVQHEWSRLPPEVMAARRPWLPTRVKDGWSDSYHAVNTISEGCVETRLSFAREACESNTGSAGVILTFDPIPRLIWPMDTTGDRDSPIILEVMGRRYESGERTTNPHEGK